MTDDMEQIRRFTKTLMREADLLDGRNDGIINREMALNALIGQRDILKMIDPTQGQLVEGIIHELRSSNVEVFSRITEAGIDRVQSRNELFRQFRAVISAGTDAAALPPAQPGSGRSL